MTTNGIVLVPKFKEVFDKLERGDKGMAKGLENNCERLKKLRLFSLIEKRLRIDLTTVYKNLQRKQNLMESSSV